MSCTSTQGYPDALVSKPPNASSGFILQANFTHGPSISSRPLADAKYGQASSHDTQSEPTPPDTVENTQDDIKILVSNGIPHRVRGEFSLFRKAKSKWPNPETSIGKFCGMKGKYSCWEAEGLAQEAFKKLSLEISALLEHSCDPVPASSQVIFDIFMVGWTQETAVPQIMFSCRKSGPRKAAMEKLRKSKILNNYPGVETGHWQFPPHIMDPRLLATGEEGGSAIVAASSKALLVPLYDSIISTSSVSSKIVAMQVHTNRTPSGCRTSLNATVGSLVRFAGKYFYISVAHAFVPSSTCTLESSLDTEDKNDDSDFEFGGLSDGYGEHDDEELEITSGGSVTSESNSEGLSFEESDISSRLPTVVPGTSDSFQIERRDSSTSLELPVGGNQPSGGAVATVFLASADLDYALIEASIEDSLTSVFDLPILSAETVGKIPSGEVPVVIVTGSSGRLYGILSGRPSYVRLLNSTTFQQAFTVTVHGPLNPGDSGSVILNPETREVYGHVVAGSSISRIAYVIPATNVLKDLELHQESSLHATTNIKAPSLQTHTQDCKEVIPLRATGLELNSGNPLLHLQNAPKLAIISSYETTPSRHSDGPSDVLDFVLQMLVEKDILQGIPSWELLKDYLARECMMAPERLEMRRGEVVERFIRCKREQLEKAFHDPTSTTSNKTTPKLAGLEQLPNQTKDVGLNREEDRDDISEDYEDYESASSMSMYSEPMKPLLPQMYSLTGHASPNPSELAKLVGLANAESIEALMRETATSNSGSQTPQQGRRPGEDMQSAPGLVPSFRRLRQPKKGPPTTISAEPHSTKRHNTRK